MRPAAARRLWRGVCCCVFFSALAAAGLCMHAPLATPAGGGRLSDILGAVSKTRGYPQMRVQQPAAVGELLRHAADSPGISLSPAAPTLPLRKRPREAEEVPIPLRAEKSRLSVADYLLKSKTGRPETH